MIFMIEACVDLLICTLRVHALYMLTDRTKTSEEASQQQKTHIYLMVLDRFECLECSSRWTTNFQFQSWN